jgi:hypothetical protein
MADQFQSAGEEIAGAAPLAPSDRLTNDICDNSCQHTLGIELWIPTCARLNWTSSASQARTGTAGFREGPVRRGTRRRAKELQKLDTEVRDLSRHPLLSPPYVAFAPQVLAVAPGILGAVLAYNSAYYNLVKEPSSVAEKNLSKAQDELKKTSGDLDEAAANVNAPALNLTTSWRSGTGAEWDSGKVL